MDSTTNLSRSKAKAKVKYQSSLKKNKEKKLNCIDSLKELRDTSQCNLDEKLKFLKSELKILNDSTIKNKEKNDVPVSGIRCGFAPFNALEGSDSNLKTERNRTPFEKTQLDDDLLILEENILKRNNNVTSTECCQLSPLKPHHSSSKFSEWLSTTIDIIDASITKSPQNKNFKCNDAIFKENPDSFCNASKLHSPNGHDVKNHFKLSQDKIESLLYKSFVVQNKYYNADDSVVEIIKTPKWKYKTRWSYAKSKKKVSQKKQNVNQLPRNRKRKRKSKSKESKNAEKNYGSHNSDVEIIPVSESSSVLEFSQLSDCLALAADINWDEPFESDDHNTSYQSSVVEIKEAHCDEANENSFFDKAKGSKNMIIDTERNKKKTEPTGRSWECPICLEGHSGQEIVTTLCGHVFCKECIQNYNLTISKSCPSCRTNLSDKPLITLFNF